MSKPIGSHLNLGDTLVSLQNCFVRHQLEELHFVKEIMFISCFPVGYREIAVKIYFDLTLVPPVKIPIFMFLLPRLIARA